MLVHNGIALVLVGLLDGVLFECVGGAEDFGANEQQRNPEKGTTICNWLLLRLQVFGGISTILLEGVL